MSSSERQNQLGHQAEEIHTEATSPEPVREPSLSTSLADPAPAHLRPQPGNETTQAGEQAQTIEQDIEAALATDLDHSDAVTLVVVPAVSLEERVASALEHAALSLPNLESASCSLESFQTGDLSTLL